jgi:heme-degrading monooxygenase HmoA
MHVRIVTFNGAKDIDAGIGFVREKVVPLVERQNGFRGLIASADRAGGVFAVLSLWETAEDRDATERDLAESRREAAAVIGSDGQVENFEQLVSEVGETPPGPGSALMVTHVRMDPSKIDENVAFFKAEIVPRIKGSAGFQGLRNMIDRRTGEGIVGTAWTDPASRDRAAQDALANRAAGEARGVSFGDVSLREIVLAELR